MKNLSFLSENFQVLVVKFSVHLNRHVFSLYDFFSDSIVHGKFRHSPVLLNFVIYMQLNFDARHIFLLIP